MTDDDQRRHRGRHAQHGDGGPGRRDEHAGSPDDFAGMPQSRGRRETPDERSDRNWNELLQELRVTQTGVQLLTGFLLTLPFQSRFTDLGPVQVGIYLVLVLLAAATTVLVIAPVSMHRLLFQRHLKAEIVRTGHRIALVGLSSLALVVTGTVLLIFDVVVGRQAAVFAAGGVLVLVLLGWVLVPVVFGRRRSRTG